MIKKTTIILTFIILSLNILHASWDDFVIKTGKIKIKFHWHFADNKEGYLSNYSTYWDLINLIFYNKEKFANLGESKTYFISYNSQSKFTAIDEKETEIRGSISFIIKTIYKYYYKKYKLEEPISDQIKFYIVNIPTKQGNITLDYSPSDKYFYNIALNPTRMGFWQQYCFLILFLF